MTAKRYRVHGTFIDDYSHTQTTVEMVMASDYDSLQAELDGPSGPTQLQQDKAEIERLREVLRRIAASHGASEHAATLVEERDRLAAQLTARTAALTDLEMAVGDLMREEDFEVSETLSVALDITRAALAAEEATALTDSAGEKP